MTDGVCSDGEVWEKTGQEGGQCIKNFILKLLFETPVKYSR